MKNKDKKILNRLLQVKSIDPEDTRMKILKILSSYSEIIDQIETEEKIIQFPKTKKTRGR